MISSQFCFWEKWGEDREFCPWRINEVVPEYGDFSKTGFWEPVFGLLVLRIAIKWGFLLPKNEMLILLFFGVSVFGKSDLLFGKQAVGFGKSHISERSPINRKSLEKQMI